MSASETALDLPLHFPNLSQAEREELMEKYRMGDHLMSMGKRDGKEIFYLPARIRLLWLQLTYPLVNSEVEVIWRSDDGKRIEVECRMFIGSCYETATIKGKDVKQGLESDLDKVSTKAQARVARNRFMIGTQYELDFDDEEPEPKTSSPRNPVNEPVTQMVRPQTTTTTVTASTKIANTNGVSASAAKPGDKKTGTATITRERVTDSPAPEPALTLATALAPDVDLETLPPAIQTVLCQLEVSFGPFELRALRGWLHQKHQIPLDPRAWNEQHLKDINGGGLDLARVWCELVDDPQFGEGAWRKGVVLIEQVEEVNRMAKTLFGMPNYKQFRDSIPNLRGKASKELTAQQADYLLRLLLRAKQTSTGKIYLEGEDAQLVQAFFGEMPAEN